MEKFKVITEPGGRGKTERGQLAAQYYQDGISYYNKGQYSSAFHSFKQAADIGSIVGSFNCGVMYRYGEGVEQDLKKALSYFEKAAVSSYPTQGVEASVDTVRAIAASKGTGEGDELFDEARLLNRIVESSRSDIEDEAYFNDSNEELYRLILAYYKASAEAGVPEGMFNCGCMYVKGQGTAQDLDTAEKYLERAKKAGVPQADAALSALSGMKKKKWGLFHRR